MVRNVPIALFLFAWMALFAGCNSAEAKTPPTSTPAPVPTVDAAQEVNEYRAHANSWPEEKKLWIDDDVVVLYTYNISNPVGEFASPAIIRHIPSGSNVYLYPWLTKPFHFKSPEGQQRLEAVLSDPVLMERILARLPEWNKAQRGPLDPVQFITTGPGDATATPTPVPSSYALSRTCSPQASEIPCGDGVKEGISYPYRMYTHCGIHWAYFDGRWWEATPLLTDGSGNPPRGWGNPYDVGRMRKVDQDHAWFTGQAGATVKFRALPREVQEYPGQICS